MNTHTFTNKTECHQQNCPYNHFTFFGHNNFTYSGRHSHDLPFPRERPRTYITVHQTEPNHQHTIHTMQLPYHWQTITQETQPCNAKTPNAETHTPHQNTTTGQTPPSTTAQPATE